MRFRHILIVAAVLAASCSQTGRKSAVSDGPTIISWDTLLSGEEIEYYEEEIRRYDEDPEYSGSDKEPPSPGVNETLDGEFIRIPGFAVGMDSVPGEYNKSRTFLFVPYQGACIHVPPPPPNQTIFVEMEQAVSTDPYVPIFLEGTIHVEAGENELAPYFYRIEGSGTKPYES